MGTRTAEQIYGPLKVENVALVRTRARLSHDDATDFIDRIYESVEGLQRKHVLAAAKGELSVEDVSRMAAGELAELREQIAESLRGYSVSESEAADVADGLVRGFVLRTWSIQQQKEMEQRRAGLDENMVNVDKVSQGDQQPSGTSATRDGAPKAVLDLRYVAGRNITEKLMNKVRSENLKTRWDHDSLWEEACRRLSAMRAAGVEIKL